MSMQKLTLIGHLGRDPEMRFTASAKAVTNFSMAVNDYHDNTMWVRVTTWDKLAESCNEYLSKGSLVYVEGRLDFDTETGNPKLFNTKDGEVRVSFEMTATNVDFLVTSKKAKSQLKSEVPWK